MSSVSVKQKMMVDGKAWLEYFGYCREPLLAEEHWIVISWDVLILLKNLFHNLGNSVHHTLLCHPEETL